MFQGFLQVNHASQLILEKIKNLKQSGRFFFHLGLCYIKEISLYWNVCKHFMLWVQFIKGEEIPYVLGVQSIKDLTNVIILHFDKYPLVGDKQADFLLFKSIVELMAQKKHLTIKGLHEIVSIRASMNRGLSDELVKAFPDITPVERPKLEVSETIDPYWVTGFVEGEGCFACVIIKSKAYKTGYQVQLKFILTQHSRDIQLMKNLVNYFGCGTLTKDSRKPVVFLTITNFSDIIQKIIPFFNKYPLEGAKRLDFQDFCKVAELMIKKAHLTVSGLEKIQRIKTGMNTQRML